MVAPTCDAVMRQRCEILVAQSADGSTCPCDGPRHTNPAATGPPTCVAVRREQAAFHESAARLECQTLVDCAACYDDVAVRFAHCGCTPDRVASLVQQPWPDGHDTESIPGFRGAATYYEGHDNRFYENPSDPLAH